MNELFRNIKEKVHIPTDIDFEIRSVKVRRILIAVLVVFSFTYVIIQVGGMFDSPVRLDTETAKTMTVVTDITSSAFVLREESYVMNSYEGTVVPSVPNGSKVGIDDTVARVYETEDEAKAAARIKEIDYDLEYYRDIMRSGEGTLSGNFEMYQSKVFDSLTGILEAINGNELEKLNSLTREMRETVTKRDILSGDTVDVSASINSLTNENAALSDSIRHYDNVVSDRTGYFVNTADGYENVGDYESVKDITAEEVEELLASEPAEVDPRVAGRIITQYNWYLVCCVPAKDAVRMEIGGALMVNFPNATVDEQRMILVAANESEDGETVTLVLRSNIMTADIASLRKCTVKISTGEFTGLGLEPTAIRTVDGETGVYVQYNSVVEFKKVHIVYSDSDIVLVTGANLKENENESDYIRENDEVIRKGKKLYDRKSF